MGLREKIAAIVRAEAEENWNIDVFMASDDELATLADHILAIPEIAEALSHHRAAKDALDSFGEFTVSRKLGHSISTNPPR